MRVSVTLSEILKTGFVAARPIYIYFLSLKRCFRILKRQYLTELGRIYHLGCIVILDPILTYAIANNPYII